MPILRPRSGISATTVNLEEELNDMLLRVNASRRSSSRRSTTSRPSATTSRRSSMRPTRASWACPSFTHGNAPLLAGAQPQVHRVPLAGAQAEQRGHFRHPDNRTPVERVAMTNGKDVEDLWYPWDFLHFRRMFRQRFTEHGEPIFCGGKAFTKSCASPSTRWSCTARRFSRTATRSTSTCRSSRHRADEDGAALAAAASVQARLRQFRQSGRAPNAPSDFAVYYNALALDTIIYLAQPKGFNNTITKMQARADSRCIRYRTADRPLLLHHRHAPLLVRVGPRRQNGSPGSVWQIAARAGHALSAQDQIDSPPDHPVPTSGSAISTRCSKARRPNNWTSRR
jgi:hypothetical protein